jgi:selenophosphate synthetase-related protein
MDIQQAQEIIHELEAICKKHNIALIGGSITDDVRAEIRIIATDDLTNDDVDHLSSGDEPYKVQGITVVNGIA